MALLGPDGNPMGDMPEKLVGQTKLEDLECFNAKELELLSLPLKEALKAGVPLMSECNVEFIMMARMLVTAQRLMEERDGGEE